MNNATLALNVARPPAPATSPAAGHAQDEVQPPSKRFDAALDAAHADARAPHKQPEAATKEKNAPPSAKAAVSKAGDKQDDKPGKKGDESDDGTSIATTMLSLIGVPQGVTSVAARALGAAKAGGVVDAAAADGAFGAAASLAGVLPGGAAANAAAGGLKDATTDASLGMTSGSLPAGTLAGVGTVAPPSFAALLATQVGAKAVKDDSASSVDATSGSPMPFAHTQGLGQGATPIMQWQATQPATSPQFAQELGEQIAWMGSGQVKEARIKLHPEELGSMDVRVSMDGGKVNVAVMAQHPAAVHAVQQTLSQLDSMLAHHGLSLGQADVGQRHAEQGADNGSGNGSGEPGDAGTASVETVATSRVSRGLVDEVA